MNETLQAATDQWREALVSEGFSDDGEQLEGPVRWTAPELGSLVARVRVTPTRMFPFAQPKVTILDAGATLEPTFHVDADGVPCLWEDEWAVDEAPWRDPEQLVRRIGDWLTQTATGWPGDDSTDLERYLERDSDLMVLYDGAALTFNAPVRTTKGPAPNTVMITREVRKSDDLGADRRHKKTRDLAWVADIGPITRPIRSWNNVAGALGSSATKVAGLISFGTINLILLRYSHGGAIGALALSVSRQGAGIALVACESADTSAATRAMRAGPLASRLVDMRVAVVGCGAIGSFAADLLFRSGVRHLTLVDGERLRPGNVVRHRAGLAQVGLPKVEAVRACLTEVDRDVSGVSTMSWLATAEAAEELLREHEVVLDATGSARASSLLATVAEAIGHQSGHSVVSACVQRDGDVVRVDRLPLRFGETHLVAPPPQDSPGGLRERGCGSPVSPTPPIAVIAAAELAVQVVIDEALGSRRLAATIAEVRSPQADAPYRRAGILTSADADVIAASAE